MAVTARTADTARRRAELAEAAARLFHRRGFHRVSLAEVAGEVGITAPALYRHHRGKGALLVGAIAGGLDVADAALGNENTPLDALLPELADAALRRPDVWTLLQRELRHLDGAERAAAQARFDRFVRRFTARLRSTRPDLDRAALRLLVTAVLATLASPSVATVRTPRAHYRHALTAAALAAARTTLPPPGPATRPGKPATATEPANRGEQLLDTAVALFHQRGYAAVSLDDIGARAGLAGPSVYHHFPTKSALLVTAFARAAHRLARPPHTGLDTLVRDYVALGVGQRELFGVYVTEAVNLPPADARRIRRALAAGVDQWVTALCVQRPGLDRPTARVLVHAARSVVGDVVRIGDLHTRPRLAAELAALVHAVLGAPTPPERSVP